MIGCMAAILKILPIIDWYAVRTNNMPIPTVSAVLALHNPLPQYANGVCILKGIGSNASSVKAVAM